MAYITFQPLDYFNTKIFTGNGSTQSITGIGFQPDWVWIKNRDTVNHNVLYDAVRGGSKVLYSNLTQVEATVSGVTAFDSDGFTLGSDSDTNRNTNSHVSWNWLANGSGSANTDGDINSTVSANTTSGFSIVKYTGSGITGETVGHGLGVSPNVVILKRLTGGTGGWRVYHSSIHASSGETKTLTLNGTDANASDIDNISGVSSTTFTTRGTGATNASGSDFIAYCFAEKKGYSKFGSYTGNGNANGPFVYTGFRPAWVMIKQSSSAGNNWWIIDNKRVGYNSQNNVLFASLNNAEDTSVANNIEILSNGFKFRATGSGINASGSTYIYMAFAENPIVSSNDIPGVAR